MEDALWYQRLPSSVGTLFASVVGIVALFLAGIGICGTIAYGITQRMREIGIRMALGARSGSILRLVLSRTMIFVGAGAFVGMIGAAGLSQAILAVPYLGSRLLFGGSATDPTAFIAAGAFLLAVAALAALCLSKIPSGHSACGISILAPAVLT